MKQSISRLLEFKKVLSGDWQTTEQIAEQLGWYDNRMVLRCYEELKYLGFNVEKVKNSRFNQNMYRYNGGLVDVCC